MPAARSLDCTPLSSGQAPLCNACHLACYQMGPSQQSLLLPLILLLRYGSPPLQLICPALDTLTFRWASGRLHSGYVCTPGSHECWAILYWTGLLVHCCLWATKAHMVHLWLQDAASMEEDVPLRLEVHSEADTRRSSSSSEGSLAALFYPPLLHEKAAAGDAGTPRSHIRQSDTSKLPLSASRVPGTPVLGRDFLVLLISCAGPHCTL